jgi:hypothetical protein
MQPLIEALYVAAGLAEEAYRLPGRARTVGVAGELAQAWRALGIERNVILSLFLHLASERHHELLSIQARKAGFRRRRSRTLRVRR